MVICLISVRSTIITCTAYESKIIIIIIILGTRFLTQTEKEMTFQGEDLWNPEVNE